MPAFFGQLGCSAVSATFSLRHRCAASPRISASFDSLLSIVRRRCSSYSLRSDIDVATFVALTLMGANFGASGRQDSQTT